MKRKVVIEIELSVSGPRLSDEELLEIVSDRYGVAQFIHHPGGAIASTTEIKIRLD